MAILTSFAINYLFAKLRIGGNTIEGYLNDFVEIGKDFFWTGMVILNA